MAVSAPDAGGDITIDHTVLRSQYVGVWLSASELDGAPVEVWMCDDMLRPKKVLHSGEGGVDELGM